MKHITFLACALLGISFASCCQNTKELKTMETQKKTLVVYFSATGTTKAAAEKITKATNGDIAEIEPVEAYTDADLDWHNDKSRSSVEMKDSKSRPACKPIDVKQYEVIYIGFPIWWYEAPRIINSFIESSNLDGKTLVPFATSGGSTIAKSEQNLKKAYPSLKWKEGKLLNNVSQKELEEWVRKSL